MRPIREKLCFFSFTFHLITGMYIVYIYAIGTAQNALRRYTVGTFEKAACGMNHNTYQLWQVSMIADFISAVEISRVRILFGVAASYNIRMSNPRIWPCHLLPAIKVLVYLTALCLLAQVISFRGLT